MNRRLDEDSDSGSSSDEEDHYPFKFPSRLSEFEVAERVRKSAFTLKACAAIRNQRRRRRAEDAIFSRVFWHFWDGCPGFDGSEDDGGAASLLLDTAENMASRVAAWMDELDDPRGFDPRDADVLREAVPGLNFSSKSFSRAHGVIEAKVAWFLLRNNDTMDKLREALLRRASLLLALGRTVRTSTDWPARIIFTACAG